MGNNAALQGTIMLVVGLVLIAVSAVLIVVTAEGSPETLGVMGIVFAAIGAQRRRDALRRR